MSKLFCPEGCLLVQEPFVNMPTTWMSVAWMKHSLQVVGGTDEGGTSYIALGRILEYPALQEGRDYGNLQGTTQVEPSPEAVPAFSYKGSTYTPYYPST